MVLINGSLVTWMDLNQWTQANKRPNGTDTKFDWVLKDFPRSGHIGLQDHGHDAWYKNIKIRASYPREFGAGKGKQAGQAKSFCNQPCFDTTG